MNVCNTYSVLAQSVSAVQSISCVQDALVVMYDHLCAAWVATAAL